ncbi:glycine cleavage system aminomethyltransferase GcvT [Mycetocola manganoxydans]|uniref:Aminomethyltransferase n=1 Tax=Mycetocola manganoxydans TaxID=699879 RepID=A0A3L6ZSN2_9MICO|nr:glycine cleavage system aminomethyltransferase GcvT [Mycetocola manganoxydans]RLP70819.1 glycine cleavage system aminomethyltransferase GcvT [Mycetocola manganoxydans]GHD48152.1 aminomethyltransferase [Mycetocola manganoxydans]
MSDPVPERTSPLVDVHTQLGASFTDFAGWQMPVRYTSDLAEHAAVRTAAGLFDLSHMAEILVYGRDAAAFLDAALAGKLSAIELMQAKYSLILTESGGILDDVVVYRLGDTTFLVVANAGNREAAFTALRDRSSGFEVTVDDQSDDYALLAVQGPNSRAILEATAGITELALPLDGLRYYRATDAFFEGVPLLIARTGYTGEDGFELYLRTTSAVSLWRALEKAGEDHGLVPAGLASRDTLRLEAGMPLYGHELDLETQPAQAGLGRVVALTKHNDFPGRAAVEAGPAENARVLVGLASEGRRAGRAGYSVLSGDTVVGTVTSGALSPTLGHPIMMGFVDPTLTEPGTELAVDVRGTAIPATVTPLPFYRRKK